MAEQLVQFECAECGRSFWMLVGQRTYPLCAACLTMPGWESDPELARYFAVQPAPAQTLRRRADRFADTAIAAVISLGWIALIIITLVFMFVGAKP